MKHLVFMICLLFCVNGLAGTTDPYVSDTKYVEYGKKYECVLPIAGIYGDKLNSSFRASCVVIDEYHILTAAHVVNGSITQHVLKDNKAYPCSIVAIHAKYNPKVLGKHDIAIARLQRPIKLDFYPELYDKKDELNKICGLAGFGHFGTYAEGFKNSKFDNQRRAGSNIISSIRDNVLVFSVQDQPSTSLEMLICPGDSGGGLFIDQKLAGIHSFVSATDGKADSNFKDDGCSTRISVYNDWITETKKIINNIITEANKENK